MKGPLYMKMSYLCEGDLKSKKERMVKGFQCRVWDHEYRHLEGVLPILSEICEGEFDLKP